MIWFCPLTTSRNSPHAFGSFPPPQLDTVVSMQYNLNIRSSQSYIQTNLLFHHFTWSPFAWNTPPQPHNPLSTRMWDTNTSPVLYPAVYQSCGDTQVKLQKNECVSSNLARIFKLAWQHLSLQNMHVFVVALDGD